MKLSSFVTNKLMLVLTSVALCVSNRPLTTDEITNETHFSELKRGDVDQGWNLEGVVVET